MKRWILLIGIGLWGWMACRASREATSIPSPKDRHFEQTEVPQTLTHPSERADWIALHYWDRFDFTDTTGIRSSAFLEQALKDYLVLLRTASSERQAEGLKTLVQKAGQETPKAMLLFFDEKLEEYLAYSYSPLQNYEQYMAVLEAILQSDRYDEDEKIRPATLLELCLKNRVGTVAENFAYALSDKDSPVFRLHDLKAERLILLFFDPECLHCRQLIDQMKQSPTLNAQQQSGRLKILTIYPYADVEAWRERVGLLSTNWINSYNPESSILSDELYELKITPALYLLDGQKRVIVREGGLSEVEQALITTQSE